MNYYLEFSLLRSWFNVFLEKHVFQLLVDLFYLNYNNIHNASGTFQA